MPFLEFSISGDKELVRWLKEKGPRIAQVLTSRVNILLRSLAAYIIQEKLSGQVLEKRTGTLQRSVTWTRAQYSGGRITGGSVQAGGGPAFYGSIHEFGGDRAYQIMAVRGRALRFISGGETVFRQSVTHPRIKTRSFFFSSVREYMSEFNSELQDAVNEATKK
jgi:hypothetical protein